MKLHLRVTFQTGTEEVTAEDYVGYRTCFFDFSDSLLNERVSKRAFTLGVLITFAEACRSAVF